MDDLTEILRQFTRLTIGHGPAPQAPASDVARSPAERASAPASSLEPFGYDAEPAVAFPAESETEVGSREFAAAVEELAAELYRDQPPPPWFGEVIGFLVEQGWMPEVPDAEELQALAADVTGAPAEDVGPAEVDRALSDLAREAAAVAVLAVPALAGEDREAAESAADPGLGEFDADRFDREWRELVEDPARWEDVVRATARASELIGRPEREIEVNTRTPIAELSPLGQAIRWLAFRIYHDPAGQAGAEVLAEALAARLETLLGPPPVVTEDSPSFDDLAQREDYDNRFRELERHANDLIARIPGSSREHQSLQRELAQIVGTFDELLGSPLTQETLNVLGEIYAELETFGRRLEYRQAGATM